MTTESGELQRFCWGRRGMLRDPDGHYVTHAEHIADRASRQVANKAEVEPAFIYSGQQGRDLEDKLEGYTHGTAFYAIPPATTGASAAELQAKLDEYMTAAHNWASRAGDAEARALVSDEDILMLHRQLAAERLRADQGWERAEAKSRECIDLRERMAGSVGASTVLTDERISEIATLTCNDEDYGGFHFTNSGRYSVLSFARAIEREVAAQAGQVAVPEGFVLVPVKPTPKMVDATFNHVHLGSESHNARNKRIYAAMIAAAPSPAKESK